MASSSDCQENEPFNEKNAQNKHPLHWFVWHDDKIQLEQALNGDLKVRFGYIGRIINY